MIKSSLEINNKHKENAMENMYMEPTADCDRVIYTASDFARDHLIHLQEAGKLTATQPHASHRGQLKSYLLLIVTSGSGQLKYRDSSFDMGTGDCALIDCTENYTHTTTNDPWSLAWVHFYGGEFTAIYDRFFKNAEKIVFHLNNYTTITQHIDEICMIAKSTNVIKDLKIHENILSIINHILGSPAFFTPGPDISAKWIESLELIKAYMDDHFDEHISLEDLSLKFYLNKYTMVRYFKSYYGISPVAYLLQVRITNAKRLLRFANLSVEEIALKSGFQDANYFSRAFKKIELTTPGEYRRQWITQGENK